MPTGCIGELTNRPRHLCGMVFVLIGTIAVMVRADEKTETGKSRNDRLATRRFELMKKRVTDGNVRSAEPGFPTQFTITPIFKYSDPARGYVAAAVWKLGDRGRPRALLATELDRSTHGRPCISYEYSSLTTAPFSLSSDDMHWSPSGTLYQFKPVPNTPAPEDTSQRRLIQIREIAKRFASHEVVKDEKCELRLLPSPVDRYVPSNVDRADGAIFFFTFGTNPEVVLIIESDGRKWTYAAGRMTGAETVVLTIDDLVAWEGPPLQNGMDSPFTGSIAPIDIPGIAADGSEIAE